MRITFTGKQEKLPPNLERKLAMQFGKLSKLLDRRGEKEAQVILSSERHLQRAEVRMNFHGQTVVGAGASTDQYTAISEAVENLQKQAMKSRTKFRDTKRSAPNASVRLAPPPEPPAAPPPKAKEKKAAKKAGAAAVRPARVVDVYSKTNGKPMTIEEAMLAMEGGKDYVIYRDAESDRVSVLIRRSDGRVDLVQG